jgi:hypothetical protein
VQTFAPEGPLVVGTDETLERRRGRKIAAKGVYRDPLRSTRERFVKTSGLKRWICVVLLADASGGLLGFGLYRFSQRWPTRSVTPKSSRQAAQEDNRVGLAAASFGETLVPTARDRRRRRSCLRIAQTARERCRSLSNPITCITRLRLDAALYERGSTTLPRPDGEDLASKVRGCRTSRLLPKIPPRSGRPSR